MAAPPGITQKHTVHTDLLCGGLVLDGRSSAGSKDTYLQCTLNGNCTKGNHAIPLQIYGLTSISYIFLLTPQGCYAYEGSFYARSIAN